MSTTETDGLHEYYMGVSFVCLATFRILVICRDRWTAWVLHGCIVCVSGHIQNTSYMQRQMDCMSTTWVYRSCFWPHS